MTDFTLLMLEISGIQDFIFGSNNLRINTSSSALIFAVTEQWIPSLLPGLYEVGEQEKKAPLNKEESPHNDLNVESIYMGGGNAFLCFERENDISKFIRDLSRQLLLEAPDLRAVIATCPFNWETDVLTAKHKKLRESLAQQKQHLAPNLPMSGESVSAACSFSGQPASKPWFDRLISYSIQQRLEYLQLADDYLFGLVPDIQEARFDLIRDFDDFGDEGSSFIAVVHADGNRMGERIKALAKECKTPAQNRNYAQRLHTFSDKTRRAAKKALRETALQLLKLKQWDKENECWYWQRRIGVQPGDHERLPSAVLRNNIFPFRPIVFGGDDVTFVCDGRLGLALAHHYLQVYGEQLLADGQPAVGRAGIAIVNTHYPFAQAYGLAEELAKSAKDAGEDGTVATLDWQFGVNGVLDSLKNIRETNYMVKEGSLTTRPLRLTPLDARDQQDWRTFEKMVADFQIEKPWRDKRSKLKGLQTALRGGAVQTRAYRTNYQLPELPEVDKSQHDLARDGWFGNKCPYFDPLEALDYFIPLEEPA